MRRLLNTHKIWSSMFIKLMYYYKLDNIYTVYDTLVCFWLFKFKELFRLYKLNSIKVFV